MHEQLSCPLLVHSRNHNTIFYDLNITHLKLPLFIYCFGFELSQQASYKSFFSFAFQILEQQIQPISIRGQKRINKGMQHRAKKPWNVQHAHWAESRLSGNGFGQWMQASRRANFWPVGINLFQPLRRSHGCRRDLREQRGGTMFTI